MGSYLLQLVISVLLLETLFPGSHLAYADTDPVCYSACACCIDKECVPEAYYPCTKGCIDGHRGRKCYELCADNCKSCPVRGECQTCYDGFYLYQNKQCLNCPQNCKTCTSITSCTSCKEGFENKHGSTACEYSLCPGNCICTQSNCVACKQGFFDTGSSCSRLCPDHCVSCSSQTECNACKEGYYNGNKLMNNINLLFVNCTHQCRETCISCFSYDQCLKCIQGKYGSQCLSDCSIGCVGNTCSIDAGTCECGVNFVGSECDECVIGRYGDVCDKRCPEHCKGDVCDRWSGNCKECESSFTGDKCDACVLGKHGFLCTENCPYNCFNSRCKRNSGECSEGCAGYFNGSRCTQCKYEKYGSECELDCPRNCLNNICDRQSGNCLTCKGNFEGVKCNHCRPGFFGTDCSQFCSPQCLHGTCDFSDGKCASGCKGNFSGDRCCTKGENCVECLTNTECGTCAAGYFGCSCDKNCSAECAKSCDIVTGTCKDIQNQQEETNTYPFVISAALGSVLLFVNIGLLVYIVVKKIRKSRRAQTEHTYDNQLATSETHFSERKPEADVPQTEAAKRCIYEDINRENETEHEYNI